MVGSLSAKDAVILPLKYSPSYLCNNLTYCESQFSYIHGNDVVVVSEHAKKLSHSKIIKREAIQPFQSKYVQLGEKIYLVIATATGVQVNLQLQTIFNNCNPDLLRRRNQSNL
jgi:hypothetical protein